jgi:hypothetical protein
MRDRVSTGIAGFDQVIDDLRLGDNVVWQVDSTTDYRRVVSPYVAQALADGRPVVYVRFGRHESLVADTTGVEICHVDPTQGFEGFATDVHNLVSRWGRGAFYVFDCLTDLVQYWNSDLMIGNFFRVTCPFLYELDTIAYFAITRDVHTYQTVASIRETTQLLLDLYQVDGGIYVHPLKVWQRYSPMMFLPHLIRGGEATCITASAEATELFPKINRHGDRIDHWTVAFSKARQALTRPREEQDVIKRSLMLMVIGKPSRMFDLCERYFALADLLAIDSRMVGTGFIGGKSVGMLLARKILEREGGERIVSFLEPHDSYYLGSDVFYTYIVQNGWWRLRVNQRTPEGYYQHAPELREKLLHGEFPEFIREQFMEMLEHFGQSPIVVRSSSLLEDDFGNAFAGKYESVFCVNQGSPEERYEAFENAVRTVYASTMSPEALDYRINRGLADRDEQMAILVQRVSGDRHEDDYFPHVAGVGNSSNLYLWDPALDGDAGMLRMVLGLGTRAVNRTVGDYARIVSLDDPLRLPPMAHGEEKKYSQRRVDVLSLTQNAWTTRRLEEVIPYDLKTEKTFFMSVDHQTQRTMREMGRRLVGTPYILDFDGLLTGTEFPALMREVLARLARVYEYPVDVEFTANFYTGSDFRVNILQCRPMQTKGLGTPVPIPQIEDPGSCVLSCRGTFMGGNVRIPLDHIVYVRPAEYLRLGEREKHAVARLVGRLNNVLQGRSVMLLGPGRWGTTTPSLGVPVRFAELSNMAVIGELTSPDAEFLPELSYGSHMFLDLVESGIFYLAVFDGRPDVVFNPGHILERPNQVGSLIPTPSELLDVVHVADATGIEMYSDIGTQTVLCR